MTASKIEKLLTTTKYDIDPCAKESLHTRLLESKRKYIFNLNIFKTMNIKLLTLVGVLLVLTLGGLYAYSMYYSSKVYADLNVNKVLGTANDLPDYKPLKNTKEGQVYKQDGTDNLALSKTEDGQPVFYIWKDEPKTDVSLEAQLVAQKADKKDYADSTVTYDVATGKTTISAKSTTDVSDSNDSGTEPGNSGSGEAKGPNMGTPTIQNAGKEIVDSPEYTKCLNTDGSTVEPMYPPVCVYQNGNKVAAQYK